MIRPPSMSRAANAKELQDARNMFGGMAIGPRAAVVPVVEPAAAKKMASEPKRTAGKTKAKIVEESSEEDPDALTIKSIIRDKPKNKEVRRFYEENLKAICDGDEF